MKKSSGAPDHWVNAYIFVRSISKYIKFILASSYHLLLIPLFNLGSKTGSHFLRLHYKVYE